MSADSGVTIRAEERDDPDLRRLARALIELAIAGGESKSDEAAESTGEAAA